MKKVLALLCVAGLSLTNAYASESTWSMYVPGKTFTVNDSNKNIGVAVLVKSNFMNTTTGKMTPSDKVSFLCNGVKHPMQPEVWMSCETKPGKSAGIEIADKDFKNGAGGSWQDNFGQRRHA